MSFSSEKYLEEILFEAHNNGTYVKLMENVKLLEDKGFKGPRIDIYIKALQQLK